MCSLFGFMDFKNSLSYRRKQKILQVLSKQCEVRGTDATGIAYNCDGHLKVYKRPLAAHKMRFSLPRSVNIVMGHTRMTTQGSEKKNYNNHPFVGSAVHAPFALAHNGVLYNDKELKLTEKLPLTNIETDSFVAVQLLEKENALDFLALKKMAEKVRGSFCFTVLDSENNLFLVKGDNPLAVYFFEGFCIYASTYEILNRTLKKLGMDKLKHQEIQLHNGEILKISPDGAMDKAEFESSSFGFGGFYPYRSCIFDDPWLYRNMGDDDETYPDILLDSAKSMGASVDDVKLLLDFGCEPEEIEELLYEPAYLHELAMEIYADCV